MIQVTFYVYTQSCLLKFYNSLLSIHFSASMSLLGISSRKFKFFINSNTSLPLSNLFHYHNYKTVTSHHISSSQTMKQCCNLLFNIKLSRHIWWYREEVWILVHDCWSSCTHQLKNVWNRWISKICGLWTPGCLACIRSLFWGFFSFFGT